MKIRNFLILGLVLLGFTYCSSDEVLDGPTAGNELATDGVKMQITVNMPTGATTRTTTEGAGSEIGSVEENKVNSVLIALYSKTKGADSTIDKFKLVNTHLSKAQNAAVTGAAYTTEEFALGANAKVGDEYYMLTFVNPYASMLTGDGASEAFKSLDYKEASNAVFTVGSSDATLKTAIDAITKKGDLATQNNFFMSNAGKVETVIVTAAHVQGSALKAAVSVQRAAARFDYNGTLKGSDGSGFTIKGISDLKVEFTHYKPMNASKSFYNFKHGNDGSDITADPETLFEAFGVAETNSNYVVDTDWTTKKSGAIGKNWMGNFYSYMGSKKTVLDDYVSLTADADSNDSFYTTENTLPADQNNKKGVATAIVFKGKLVFTADDSDNKPVYVYNNTFYKTFAALPEQIKAIVRGPLVAGGETAATKDALVAATHIKAKAIELAAAGVTSYSFDVAYGGYPVYYVYYNAHNQDADQAAKADVGAMEFGVVRNNIYKLSINSLNKIGHPNDPELIQVKPQIDADGNPTGKYEDQNGTEYDNLNDLPVVNPDPSPERPTDPIKSKDLYMQVSVTVLDWTVRQNNIDF